MGSPNVPAEGPPFRARREKGLEEAAVALVRESMTDRPSASARGDVWRSTPVRHGLTLMKRHGCLVGRGDVARTSVELCISGCASKGA